MLYAVADQAPRLACDECGAVVDGSERGRALHERWHQPVAEAVDLVVLEQVRETA